MTIAVIGGYWLVVGKAQGALGDADYSQPRNTARRFEE
jgi:hypothetical protein